MIVLDTTVLLYAVGTEHRLREPCRTLIDAIRRGDVVATTTVEAIQDFTHVRAPAAAAKAAGAPVVSADAAFASVPGLIHVTPDEKGVQGLLATGDIARD